MSLALDTASRLRFSGRSFMAFVLQPVPPVAAWLEEIDRIAGQSGTVFRQRPVVLDLSILEPDRAQIESILSALASRQVRVIAVDGVDPNLVDPLLAPLDATARSGKIIEFPCAGRPAGSTVDQPASAATTPGSLLIEQVVRSGQSIVFPGGDVTVIGAVSSGAEIVAGGSIHVYGALRGRAIAGSTGERRARIFCSSFKAELVAIDGCYLTAEMVDRALVGKAVEIRLEGDSIKVESNNER